MIKFRHCSVHFISNGSNEFWLHSRLNHPNHPIKNGRSRFISGGWTTGDESNSELKLKASSVKQKNPSNLWAHANSSYWFYVISCDCGPHIYIFFTHAMHGMFTYDVLPFVSLTEDLLQSGLYVALSGCMRTQKILENINNWMGHTKLTRYMYVANMWSSTEGRNPVGF